VFVVAVKGEALVLESFCRAGSVIIGGKDKAGFVVVSNVCTGRGCREGLSAVGCLDLCNLFGDCAVEAPKVNVPEPPKLIRLEKLFDLAFAVELLLEVVDCDQRLRFPMPSLTPLTLFDRLCEALGRRPCSWDVTALEELATPSEPYVGICESGGEASVREVDRAGPIGAAR
jgi:hypothetical protein